MIDKQDHSAGHAATAEPAPRRRRRLRSISRARLMAEATELFYEQGVRAVSIDDIVAAAEMTKPTLYRHFPSKDALLTACVAADSARLFAELEDVVARAESTPAAQLAAVARHYAEAIRGDHRRGILAANVVVEFPDPHHPVRAVVAQATARFHAHLAKILSPVAGPAADAAAAHLILVILGACTLSQTLGGAVAADALLCAVESVMACVAERAGAAPHANAARV